MCMSSRQFWQRSLHSKLALNCYCISRVMRQFQKLVLEASGAALHPILDQVRPHELDHPCIVVAIREIVIQRREAMLLACFLHTCELAVVEVVLIDVAPIVGGSVHREAGSDGAVGSDDDIILASAAVPLGKMQFAIGILDDSRSIDQPLGNVAVRSRTVPIPA